MSKITQRSNSGDISGLEDIEPPVGSFLSGKYKRSFAYTTLKDRLPVILTQIIDNLSRSKEEIAEKYGADAVEESKQVVGAISKLKNELVTNKPILLLPLIQERTNDDTLIWNDKLEKLSKLQDETLCWFNAVWLTSECYMYRKIKQEFMLTNHLKLYDPFERQKQESYFKAEGSISHLSAELVQLASNKNNNLAELQNNLINLIKINLWGNRCDLSLSAGVSDNQDHNPLHILESLNELILVDNSREVWELLSKTAQSTNNRIIDIILDNSGYELFTDLCLVVFLIAKNFTNKIRLYVKRYPWFISDVTVNDFHWFIETMVHSENLNIKSFGCICQKYLKDGLLTIEEESFWTEPFDFSEMQSEAPCLYNKLSEAILVIFKGDLNYRKLLGDINWKHTTNFLEALRGFRPTNLLSLRTMKADLCVGLPDGRADSLSKEEPDWMITGKYGLIQASINI